MPFYRHGAVYRARELDSLGWLVHGFGTRMADVPADYPMLATLKQIHSCTCIPAGGRSGVLGQGDALVENTPGAVVAVKTADCIPVLLVDERLRAVAAVHAGWRGTVAGIVRHAVKAMQASFGSKVDDLHAAIGPGIGKCCYEVGPEVAIQFQQQGRVHLDLPEVNRSQLVEAGLAPERVYTAGLCTMCLPEFHSFRRDRQDVGRQYAFAGVLPALQ